MPATLTSTQRPMRDQPIRRMRPARGDGSRGADARRIAQAMRAARTLKTTGR